MPSRPILRIGNRILAHRASRTDGAVDRNTDHNYEIQNSFHHPNLPPLAASADQVTFAFQHKESHSIREAASGSNPRHPTLLYPRKQMIQHPINDNPGHRHVKPHPKTPRRHPSMQRPFPPIRQHQTGDNHRHHHRRQNRVRQQDHVQIHIPQPIRHRRKRIPNPRHPNMCMINQITRQKSRRRTDRADDQPRMRPNFFGFDADVRRHQKHGAGRIQRRINFRQVVDRHGLDPSSASAPWHPPPASPSHLRR